MKISMRTTMTIKKKHKNIIFMAMLVIAALFCYSPKAHASSICEHMESDLRHTYTYIDQQYDSVEVYCSRCKVGETRKVTHYIRTYADERFYDSYACVDGKCYGIYTCTHCQHEITEEIEHKYTRDCNSYAYSHYIGDRVPNVKIDENNHGVTEVCVHCGDIRVFPEKHYWSEDFKEYTVVDDHYHGVPYYCSNCDATSVAESMHDFDNYRVIGAHDKNGLCTEIRKCPKCDYTWDGSQKEHRYSPYPQYISLNDWSHIVRYTCYECGKKKDVVLNHDDITYLRVIQDASPTQDGIVEYYCYTCEGIIHRAEKYKYPGNGFTNDSPAYSALTYDVASHSDLYRKSTSMTIRFNRVQKGSVVKLKIGKKTYTKKLTSTKKRIKIKIKKPSYGSKFSIKIYYKNKLIGKDYCVGDDVVYYGKDIKKGMTKKQVKYLSYWGAPYEVGSSGGYTYWYYRSGSYVIFKKNKVVQYYYHYGK